MNKVLFINKYKSTVYNFQNKRIMHPTYPNILYLVAVPPLFVIEFLHRVVDTFEDYFGECTESIIKENYVVVYEVCPVFIY